MDAVSYSLASKQAQRIEKFIENPDSTSGIVTVPKTIATGETVTVPVGRVAVLPNVVVDGTLNIDGEVFIPSGSSVDFSNGIKIDGNNIALSIPTSYHLLQGNLSVSNEVITNGFGTTLYTGNGGTQSINTGIDMATQWGNDASETFGGLVWLKSRSTTAGHALFDTVRGVTNTIATEATTAQSTVANSLTAFNNNGFSIGSYIGVNGTAYSEASWNFQTTHRKTGVTNHGKAYTEHYNPFTGFTIIKYEGSGLAGHEIPHSLGRKLGFVTIKSLALVDGWVSQYRESNFMSLNTTTAETSNTNIITSFDVDKNICGTSSSVNISASQYIMYGWANSYLDETNKLIGNYEIGIYQGTGVAGNKVTTRGKPAWVMIKRLDSTGSWAMVDNQRGTSPTKALFLNVINAEDSPTPSNYIQFSVDNFTINATTAEINVSGGQYLYMVVYDNDSGSGKSKYPKATDTSNVQINNALIPLAHGIDSNGSKNSIVIANEIITGLTYTQGKNYLYKTDTGYGVKPYEPRYLSSELVRRYAGEQPDYYDVKSNKWFNTEAGSELVTNGKFNSNTNGWVDSTATSTVAWESGRMKVTRTSGIGSHPIQTISGLTIGKKYKFIATINPLNNGCGIKITDNSTNLAQATNNANITEYVNMTIIPISTEIKINAVLDIVGQVVYFDNISVFPVDITPTTEITESRNYLNHIVHADQNGQVTYVEELPKIEYKDIVKANEFRGKNACTAWVDFTGNTTTPTIRASYNISAIIRTATGIYDVYFKEAMDNLNYTVSHPTLYGTSSGSVGAYKYLNKVTLQIYSGGDLTSAFSDISIQIFGGRN